MALGATMSAPASAYATAARARSGSVASLATAYRSSRTPQWPCEVYSQRQTSAMTVTAESRRLISEIARGTGPAGSQAPLPCSSLSSGMPNSSTDGTPSSPRSPTSASSRSTVRCAWPGMLAIGRSVSTPSRTNSGCTSWAARSVVSPNASRSAAVRRSRRGRTRGVCETGPVSASIRSTSPSCCLGPEPPGHRVEQLVLRRVVGYDDGLEPARASGACRDRAEARGDRPSLAAEACARRIGDECVCDESYGRRTGEQQRVDSRFADPHDYLGNSRPGYGPVDDDLVHERIARPERGRQRVVGQVPARQEDASVVDVHE